MLHQSWMYGLLYIIHVFKPSCLRRPSLIKRLLCLRIKNSPVFYGKKSAIRRSNASVSYNPPPHPIKTDCQLNYYGKKAVEFWCSKSWEVIYSASLVSLSIEEGKELTPLLMTPQNAFHICSRLKIKLLLHATTRTFASTS